MSKKEQYGNSRSVSINLSDSLLFSIPVANKSHCHFFD